MLLLSLMLTLLAATAVSAQYPETQNFMQTDQTLNSITVCWDIDITEMTPVKWRIVINDLLSQEFLCSTSSCCHEVTGLEACNTYKLSLVGVFAVLQREETNTPAVINDAFTEYEVPESVQNLNQEGTSVTWTPPVNQHCVVEYEVCYYYHDTGETTCVKIPTTSLDFSELPGCDTVDVTVSAVAGNGQKGPASSIQIQSLDKIPGAPTNFEVTMIGDNTALLEWDEPLENPACVFDHSIQYGPSHETNEKDTDDDDDERAMKQDFTATLSDLPLCSNLTFEVAFVTEADDKGPEVTDWGITANVAPGEIPDITLTPDTDQIIIGWGEDTEQDACLDSIEICYSEAIGNVSGCLLIDPDGKRNITISGLSACKTYDFVIVGISPNGDLGSVYQNSTQTLDVAPGPVMNLDAASTGPTSIEVTFNEPENYAECVDQYIISVKNLEEETTKQKGVIRADFSNDIQGLEACVNYEIEVYGVSPSGLEAPIRTTMQNTDDLAPGPPRNPSIASNANTTVTLWWYAPVERFCVDSYEAQFHPTSGGSTLFEIYTPPVLYADQIFHTFEVAGMVECVSYDVKIRSNGNLGHSTFSEAGETTVVCN